MVALGRGERERWSELAKFSLASLFYWSLGTMFLAFVPVAVLSFGESVAAPWRLSHGIFAVFHGGVFVWFFHRRRVLGIPRPPFATLILGVGFGVLGLEISVASGFLGSIAPSLYLLALLWFLFLAAMSFARLVFPRELEGEPTSPP